MISIKFGFFKDFLYKSFRTYNLTVNKNSTVITKALKALTPTYQINEENLN